MVSKNLFVDTISITLDIDWVSNDIIKYVVDLLEKYSVKATFFATHDSAFLKSLDNKNYEIGLHPNFTNDSDWDKIVKELKKLYPGAIGARSHGLTQSSIIHSIFIKYDVKYDVNTYIPLRESLSPYCRPREGGKRMICLPFYWEDDGMFINSSNFEFSRLKINSSGLKIYNFHPIHIFMNTKSNEHYESYKKFYHQQEILTDYRWQGKGIGTIFLELLQYIQRNKIQARTCKEIYEKYTASGECDKIY